jgi:O-antigen/teichoic acid export membrane protein
MNILCIGSNRRKTLLSESSYLTAVYVYVGMACLILLYMTLWFSRHWRPGSVALVVLVSAALLLTPAFPNDTAITMAPALIVAGFQFFTAGYEAAEYALRLLGYACALALGLALLLRLTLFRRRVSSKAETEQ